MKQWCIFVVIASTGCWRTSSPAPVANTAPPSMATTLAEKPTVGGARMIVRTAAGGVIELDGDRQPAMDHARELMTGHCGVSQFTIVQEGEEAIGVDDGAAGVRPAIAWRVHYRCSN